MGVKPPLDLGAAPPPEPVEGDEAEELEALPVPTREDEAQETAPETKGPEPSESEVFRDRWLRAEAELKNFRRRAQRDLEEVRRASEERGLLEIIGLLDDLERGLKAAADAGAPEGWRAGFELVAQRMRDTLARYGVTPIAAIGRPFDPFLHEALLEVDPPARVPPGQVVEVARAGWQRDGRALRAARVVVAREPKDGG